MKKFMMVLVVTLFCFGCSKDDKNITINIYESGEQKETIKVEEDLQLEEDIQEVFNEVEQNELKKEENINENLDSGLSAIESNSNVNNNTSEDKSKLEEVKDWYNENKDELSDINKEILENDKNTITSIIGSASSWYNENKDELKQTSEEIYNNEKETLKDLYNKLKNNE